MSVNSWQQNWSCSFADLRGPRRKAAYLRSSVQGTVLVITGAPTLRRWLSKWEAGWGRCWTVGARSEVLWLNCTKPSQVLASDRRALALRSDLLKHLVQWFVLWWDLTLRTVEEAETHVAAGGPFWLDLRGKAGTGVSGWKGRTRPPVPQL
jgi:hypothetical protein